MKWGVGKGCFGPDYIGFSGSEEKSKNKFCGFGKTFYLCSPFGSEEKTRNQRCLLAVAK